MTVDELNAKLDAMTVQVGKIGSETSTSLTLIKQLQDEIANSGNTIPQSVVDKVNALATQLQVVDDLVPDAPPPVTP